MIYKIRVKGTPMDINFCRPRYKDTFFSQKTRESSTPRAVSRVSIASRVKKRNILLGKVLPRAINVFALDIRKYAELQNWIVIENEIVEEALYFPKYREKSYVGTEARSNTS